MKYILYPIGFDPVVACGPPGEDYLKMGIGWTPEETQESQELQLLGKEIDSDIPPPKGQWYEILGVTVDH
jgi:hypothetical protein